MKTAFVFVFRRCLQEYIPLSHTSSGRFQVAIKKSSRNLAKTSWRRLQKIFRTSCKDIFKTFCKDIFKTFSRRFQDVFKHLQDVFKMYHQVQLALLTRLQDVSKTYSTRFEKTKRRTEKTIIYRKICLGHTPGKFMVKVQIFQEPNLWICWTF